ncbi:hypothetical protein IGA67_30775, partial [Pseudomonas aeruginosa]
WHVKAGDSVRADQRLVSVETAKALVDIPAPYDGVVGKLFGADEETVLQGATAALQAPHHGTGVRLLALEAHQRFADVEDVA